MTTATLNFNDQVRHLFSDYMTAGANYPIRAMAGVTPVVKMSKAAANQLSEFSASDLVAQNKVQTMLRPLYGKSGIAPVCIGDHPDFEHLSGTDGEEFCPITTMFMDMEGSTRLNLLYSPSEVARIKNTFIRMAIEVIKSFDGHVHRIMGDAVMAYFGGLDVRDESAVIDALNCASLLQFLVRESVLPYLKQNGYDDAFGIRIGLDYGPRDRVLWRAYGYPGMEEITATSFYVDVASKLQHSAGRHQVMLGDSLKSHIDFPDELVSVRAETENGEEVQRPYLRPNITDREGKPINYRQHVLNWEKYLELSPLAQQLDLRRAGSAFSAARVSATLHKQLEGEFEAGFVSSGTLGLKGKGIKFRISKLPYVPQLPYTVKCMVENHGEEARRANETYSNHETPYEIKTQDAHRDIEHWETLAFRGLHYLIVEIRNSSRILARTKFGVYVE